VKRIVYPLLLLGAVSFGKDVELKEVSVTATRTERKTEDVPASVSVIGKEKIQNKPMLNLYDALQGVPGVNIASRNQGYDTRLIIRGGGLKATYGVREIMILLNGVPITDPDSLTRLDFVDTSLIERVEVVKGPNSTLWGVNAFGGVINVITKSPFERKGGFIKLGFGDFNTQNHNLYYSTPIGKGFYLGINVSRRQSDNSWRPWNKFWTNQITLQPSYMFENGDTWENYVSYTKASLQLPGSLVVDPAKGIDQWSEFLRTGKVPRTAEPWKHSGRYSEIFFFSSKLTKSFGNWELVPLVYLNHWQHYHPVTGRINEADTWIYGIDLQANYKHSLGTLTTGFTIRHDEQKTNYFKYMRYEESGSPARIVSTFSDEKGNLLEKQNQKTTLAGVFLQQSFQGERWILDVGARIDRVSFDISGYKWGEYSFSVGNYKMCPASGIENCFAYSRKRTYTVFSPRVGVLYKLTPIFNIYGNISTGANTPTSSELSSNPNLELAKVINYEVGLKARHEKFSLDTALYLMDVRDEVVRVNIGGGQTTFTNAGKTEKKGFEFAGTFQLIEGLEVGASYAYSDYKFKRFIEGNADRSGNRLHYIPIHQYSIFISYKHTSGFRFRVQTDTWGSYYMDNANSEKYEGYEFLTSASVGYSRGNLDLSLMVDNLFNKKYAVEVTKDTSDVKRYNPGPPRTFLVRLTYNF
jgi:iron complex outermembrane receptor protein